MALVVYNYRNYCDLWKASQVVRSYRVHLLDVSSCQDYTQQDNRISLSIYMVAQKTGPPYLIANILKIP